MCSTLSRAAYRTNAFALPIAACHSAAHDPVSLSDPRPNWSVRDSRWPCSPRSVTAERIKRTYPDLIRGAVERYELAHLHGLNFVLHDALEGGVNSSLNLDSHGKSWSFLILRLPLDEEAP